MCVPPSLQHGFLTRSWAFFLLLFWFRCWVVVWQATYPNMMRTAGSVLSGCSAFRGTWIVGVWVAHVRACIGRVSILCGIDPDEPTAAGVAVR